MDRATHICTHCGYEGRPVKPPSDAESSDGETTKALVRVANLLLPGMGFMVRPLAMVMALPLYLVLWPVKRYMKGGPKHCPNCGLPLMVKLSSDAGFVAKRRQDLKAGIRFDQPDQPTVAFGKDILLPSDEAPVEAPKFVAPTSLPSLDTLLAEEEQRAKRAESPVEEPPAPPQPTKKPVDPDQW